MNKTTLWILIAVVVIGGIVWLNVRNNGQPGKYDAFAQCLKDKGAVFYGAFWCPHCQNQKKMFGKSEKLLNYVECSTADGRGQLQVCKDKNITGYPTWEFADASRLSGEIPLENLAEKTGCALPQ
ncbi:MAG: thioredoxin domain-containing protein [Patescibacteria group bacterium]